MRRTTKHPALTLTAAAAAAGLTLTAVATTVSAASAAPAAGPTYAQPGVTYVGYTTALVGNGYPSTGGRIEVTVSADGLSVTRFAAVDVPFPVNPANAACKGTTFSYAFTGNVPITTPPGYGADYAFVDTSPAAAPELLPLDFDGSFDPGTATGRFAYEEPGWRDSPLTKCSTQGNLAWTASAPGGCTGSPEYLALDEQIKDLAKVIKKLNKKIAKAKKAGRFDQAAKLRRKVRKLKGQRGSLVDVQEPMC